MKYMNMLAGYEVSNLSIPFVIEKTSSGERSYDLGSRLLQDRIIMMNAGFDNQAADVINKCFLYLDSVKVSDITLYVNSPGGSVHDGLSIYDVANSCMSDIMTISTGMSASMGCFMTSIGAPGKRFATRFSQLMAHQVSSGTQGLVTDQIISLNHSIHLNDLLMGEMADRAGVTKEQFIKDCDRDRWMTAKEARDYGKFGIVDGVLTGKRGPDGEYEAELRDKKLVWVGGHGE